LASGELVGNQKKIDMNGCAIQTFCGTKLGEMYAKDPGVRGVFAQLINNGAFIDKLILGADATRRKRVSKDLGDIVNRAIGGPGRPYARSPRAMYKPTGNPFEMKYGASRRYPNLFDNKLILRSEAVPLAHSDTSEILDCLFRKGGRVAVLGVEFTSDVSIPLRFFENHMLTRARTSRSMVDASGRKTVYAGAPRAPWSLRVYQKTSKITRVEFAIGGVFLKKLGVREIGDLHRLKDFSWNQLVAFPSMCQRALEAAIAGKVTCRQRDIVLGWPGRWPTPMLLELLKDFGIDGEQILRPSAVGQMLEKMQRSFAWGTKP
jgi:hypothetical protein